MRRHRVALSLAASVVVIVAAVVAVALFVSSLDPKVCTLLAAEPTVTVRLEAADPADIRSGAVEVCEGDKCASGDLVFGDGPERLASARVRGMPEGRSEVTVTLETADRSLTSSTTVQPHMIFPNGRGCGGGSPQASVTWAEGGLRDSADPPPEQ